jgi:hypothetical protein
VPAGTYKLKVWHEALGVTEKTIDVKAGGSQTVDFSLAANPGVKK